MRITFVGATEFSKHCLNVIKDWAEFQVLTRANDGTHGDWADLGGIVIEDINKEAERIRAFNPDCIFVFGWSQIVGERIRGIAPCLGSHPTLLPEGRGRHALGNTLRRGLKKSGLTFFWLDEGIDTGDIFMQQEFAVGKHETLASLYNKIDWAASKVLPDIMNMLLQGVSVRIPQGEGTYWGKLPKEEQVDYTRYFSAS